MLGKTCQLKHGVLGSQTLNPGLWWASSDLSPTRVSGGSLRRKWKPKDSVYLWWVLRVWGMWGSPGDPRINPLLCGRAPPAVSERAQNSALAQGATSPCHRVARYVHSHWCKSLPRVLSWPGTPREPGRALPTVASATIWGPCSQMAAAMNHWHVVAGWSRQTSLPSCPSSSLQGQESPHIQAKLNRELECFTKHMLIASRAWCRLRREMRGSRHMVLWK